MASRRPVIQLIRGRMFDSPRRVRMIDDGTAKPRHAGRTGSNLAHAASCGGGCRSALTSENEHAFRSMAPLAPFMVGIGPSLLRVSSTLRIGLRPLWPALVVFYILRGGRRGALITVTGLGPCPGQKTGL